MWIDVPGWEGFYRFNLETHEMVRLERIVYAGHGSFKTLKQTIRKPKSNHDGYLFHDLRISDKRYRLLTHQFLCEFYHGYKPFPGACALHKDDCKLNNTKTNLYWGTMKDNANDRERNGHGRDQRGEKHNLSIYTDDQIKMVKWLDYFGVRNIEIARMMGINAQAVCDIRKGRIWSHITIDTEKE